jgi:hypothetical protein
LSIPAISQKHPVRSHSLFGPLLLYLWCSSFKPAYLCCPLYHTAAVLFIFVFPTVPNSLPPCNYSGNTWSENECFICVYCLSNWAVSCFNVKIFFLFILLSLRVPWPRAYAINFEWMNKQMTKLGQLTSNHCLWKRCLPSCLTILLTHSYDPLTLTAFTQVLFLCIYRRKRKYLFKTCIFLYFPSEGKVLSF